MKICLFADVNPNLIDGSSIWLQSMALALDRVPGAEVTVLLRDPAPDSPITRPLIERGIDLVLCDRPEGEDAPDGTALARAIEQRFHDAGDALYIVRGDAVVERLAGTGDELRNRIWPYWLRRPQLLAPEQDEFAFRVFEAFPKAIVQSAAQKAVLETIYQVPAAQLLALPPMVPDGFFESKRLGSEEPILVYSGKMDSDYNVENYIDLVAALNAGGTGCPLRVLGDKFNADPDDRQFVKRMKEKLAEAPHVDWRGGMERMAAAAQAAQATLGLCIRKSVYDSSLEISTKLVEFCALGVPPVVNRTTAHVDFLGADYPFYANSIDEAQTVIEEALADPDRIAVTGAALREKARSFAISHQAERLAHTFERAGIRDRATRASAERRNVLIAGHDLKFVNALLPQLRADGRFRLDTDEWPGTRKHDERLSLRKAGWADTVFCEWCAGPAVWYSRNLPEEKRLIVRLHRFELTTDFPGEVDFDQVDRLLVVRAEIKRQCIEEFGVAPEKIDVIPQFVDWDEFDRPKHAGAERTLGLVGINPYAIKRLDRAVDLLERLRATGEDWRLRVRSVMPWEISWTWKEEEEREAFRALFGRILAEEGLRDNILFDAPGPDMAEWYRNIGYILSTSILEGCHTSVAEGMASGAVPVLIGWEGADSVYPARFVADNLEGMAAIIEQASEDREALAGEVAEHARRFDLAHTASHLARLFTEPDLAMLAPVEHEA
ncbi:MAG: hypothetical protein ABR601_05030 [Parasphingopyxis sp.]